MQVDWTFIDFALGRLRVAAGGRRSAPSRPPVQVFFPNPGAVMPASLSCSTRLHVEADRPDAAAALHALAMDVFGEGGAVRQGTLFRAVRGDLTVHHRSPGDPTCASLIEVPLACMPPTAAFRLSLTRGRLRAARDPDGPAVTSVQARTFAGLIELYNALEKPWQWARQSPWLTLWDDPALLGHLAHAHRAVGRPRAWGLYRARAWRELLVHSFIRSRAFALRPDSGAGPPRDVLLPLLDALDHHDAAGRFQRAQRPGLEGGPRPVLAVAPAQPVAGSDACRVAYNVLDAQLALLHYGFLDSSAPFLLSVPVRVRIDAGATLCVLSATGRFHDPLPAELEPLRAWMPRVLRSPPDVLAVTRLPMPPAGEAARLVAVLRTLIARAWPNWDDARSAAAAARAAQALLAANRRDHARLVDLLAVAHRRSGRGDVPGRRATLAALDRLTALAGRHFAGH